MKAPSVVLLAVDLWYTLKTPELELRLRMEELERVHIHEEIIPELLKRLVDEVKSSSVMKDPVIMDANTLVVLDGMHRVAALKELSCKFLPACLVDHRSPSVKIGCWYRVVRGKADDSKLLELLRLLGLKCSTSSWGGALQALESRKAIGALRTKNACYQLGDPSDITESYAWIKRLERALREEGLEVDYEIESDAEREMRSEKAIAAIATPRARKEEVIEAGLSGNIFAHKTTRHTLPARPMGVNVPLGWLKGNKSLEEVNRMLVEHLSKRKVKHVPKGSSFEGRRYEEKLLVFE